MSKTHEEQTAMVLCGVSLVPQVEGALFWPAQSTLFVADLHFEKGSSFARKGVLLPPYDTRETLRRLEDVMDRLAPARVVCLGDSFHDLHAGERMDPQDMQTLHGLIQRTQWIWISGNHDPAPPEEFDGERVVLWEQGPLICRHEPTPSPAPGELSGHLHPCAVTRIRGRRFRRPCFLSTGSRAILPSFGAYTGGLNVCDPAFAPIVGSAPFHAWMLSKTRVIPVAHTRLHPDR